MSYKSDMGVFDAAYKKLNRSQQEAVDSIDGPVMVIAGPGTGKTQVLTLRIAKILLETDTAPDAILALTFTESGAKAMRERLRQYVGTAAYQLPIFTFHGFARYLIDYYPDAYPNIIGGRPANDIEKIEIIETILDSSDVTLLRPSGRPSYYVNPILRMIQTLKQEYVTPDDLRTVIQNQESELQSIEQYHQSGAHKGKLRTEYSDAEKKIAKNSELLLVYRLYQEALRSAHLYDFEDMIAETVTALEHDESMLRDLQEAYHYVLADEHQDVNGSQNRILELLSSYHDQPNIFVVGDEKQAIYRFQGASLDNFLHFQHKFNDTKVISLTDNYRSGQTILDTAHSLVEVEDGPLHDLRLPLTAQLVDVDAVERFDFSHRAVEDTWVVNTIQAMHTAGTSWEEIAIIVRTNREVELFTTALRQAHIPVAASADGDILQHTITQSVYALLDVIHSSHQDSALFTVLQGAYWKIPLADLVKVCAARNSKRPLASIISSQQELKAIGVEAISAVQQVHKVIEKARELAVTKPPHQVLEYLLQTSGLLDFVMVEDPLEGSRVVRRLYDEIESLVLQEEAATVASVQKLLAKRIDYGLPLNAPYIVTSSAAVQVMTAHKAKGLEFSAVFVPHIQDATWGGRKKPQQFKIPLTTFVEQSDFDRLDDERRLLYVAMTRAKNNLFLSTAATDSDGKVLTPSRFLAEINEAYVTHKDTSVFEKDFSPVASLGTNAESVILPQEWLTQFLTDRGFSATSLNNYLKNPWDFLYRNILRIPEIQPSHMLYGTAMHNTLEKCTKFHCSNQALPSMQQIQTWLQHELQSLPLTTNECTKLHQQGMESLAVYSEHLATVLPVRSKEEMQIKVMLPTGLPELPEVPLTGKLDRLDFAEDGSVTQVVDYKTGKPKTRNAIEGNTKNDDGSYKRQLVFYALLLELYDDERYYCRTGVLSFVEPTNKGTIREESFTISDEEIATLTQEIIDVCHAIISGDFLYNQELLAESSYSNLAKSFYERLQAHM